MTSNARKRKHETILTEQLEGLVQAVNPTSPAALSEFYDHVYSLVAASKLRKVGTYFILGHCIKG